MTTTTAHEQASTLLPLDTQAPYYKWLVAGIVLMASGTQTFAGNSITLAIPRLMATFGADLAATQWVMTGFLIARTLVIPLLGWLGGLLGHRTLFVVGMAGFFVCTIGCGLSTSLAMLIGFRLLQGLLLGSLGGLNSIILMQAFPRHQRGLALGLRAIGTSSGQIISFTLGGFLIEHLSWRVIFFLGAPAGLLAAVLGLLALPQHREAHGIPVDYPGLLTLGGFLVPLLLAISFARNNETAVSTLLLLSVIALVSSGLFIARELLTRFPVVNLRLFRLAAFRCICGTAFIHNIGLFGAQFMIPIFLQQVMGFSPMQVGLLIAPALVMSGLGGVAIGRLCDFVPLPAVVLTGLTALTLVFYTLASVTAMTTAGVLLGIIIVYRICMHAVTTPVTALNAQLLAPEQVRMGQGLLGVVRNIGASFGVTVASVLFERRRVSQQIHAYGLYNETSLTHRVTLDNIERWLYNGGMEESAARQGALRLIRRQMDIEAIASGFQGSFILACACFTLASLPMWWLLRRSRRD